MYIYIYTSCSEATGCFRECVWNNHRRRKQKGKELPTGVPEHMFQFPEKYGGNVVLT